MRSPIRLVLLLDLAAVGAVVAFLLLAVGVPAAAGGALRPATFVWLVAGAVGVGLALGVALLFRAVAKPVDRILAAAERLGSQETELPILRPLGEAGAHGLPRAAVAFERLAAALLEERTRLAAKVAELERANGELAEARESLLRSEKLATVGRLAAGVAHEVGNPLGAIGGYAELARGRLAARGGEAELLDWVERIGAESRRIDVIVRDLLDFARPAPPDLAPVPLPAVIDSALRLARMQPRFRDVEVELIFAPGLPPVRADEGRLRQLLLNLLLNAGDAMRGDGALRIEARSAGGVVRVDLADRGPGIPAADLTRVFDPFFSTKPPGEGTGLGLAICHGIMESFGGEISVASREGGGAVFSLRLPVAAGGASSAAVASSPLPHRGRGPG